MYSSSRLVFFEVQFVCSHVCLGSMNVDQMEPEAFRRFESPVFIGRSVAGVLQADSLVTGTGAKC